jgi:carboxymethylenebutenolidase
MTTISEQPAGVCRLTSGAGYARGVCHDADSLPPIASIAGAAVSHQRLLLTAADGNRLAAFAALPDVGESSGNGVVILPDVRGLYRFYEELALRFAERGIAAVAIDYFGRTAGAAPRDEAFEFVPHVVETTQEGVQADVGAALMYLRSPEGGERRSLFVVGFCFGGRHAWLATGSHDLAGAIGFYGNPGLGRDGVTPGAIQRASQLRGPILALMGGADRSIGPDVVAEFDRALTAEGIEHEIVTYEGAPHSFFDRKQEEFAEAAQDAWRRVLEFVGRHGAQKR